ncbi:cupin domain-containing protein [Lacihabitans sp. CS3-21]|jgi:quercetin dioxygenase-like cupin family protein|uniref:cupin domain-containing protein n=1 Tax=Lacihabitans sp. CS3-21 TaxID=2487332 RepID=UPI0020CD1301|nr:cupin domain-containing protein [Lacihabitans sp. CS3-21]MCP9749078.1 cupin domain-containing protein [Lacihabitans sp. CS3-21]MDP1816027.1 cupin domain-containing protein [Leadbetterella sp.]
MNTLVEDKEVEWIELGGGIKRKVMAYDDQMMVVKVAFEAGGIGAMHSHPHTQASYVASGKFDITIDGKTKTLKGGDVYFVPSDLEHGAVCLEDGELIDVFHPLREDFL